MKKISIISPVYNAQDIVNELLKKIKNNIQDITSNYEIILVDDGSSDESWLKIKKASATDSKIVGVKLSKNFGQHYAITAGLAECNGEFIIVMDCDLQDNPIYFKDLYKNAIDGADIVYTSKNKRRHSFFKNITAWLFKIIFNYLSEFQYTKTDIGNYSLISRKVVNAFLNVHDSKRHYLMILRDLGFNSKTIKINHYNRFNGESSYNFKKLLTHAIDGITYNSTKLLWLSIKLGFVFCLISFFGIFFIIYLYFTQSLLSGYPSIMIVLFLTTGLILISIGITGIYISNIFKQVKNRPLYIIEKRIN